MNEEGKEEKNMESKISEKEKSGEIGNEESEVENVETKEEREGIMEKESRETKEEKSEKPKTKKDSNFLYIILALGFVVVIVLTALPIFMGSNVDNTFAEKMAQYDTNPPTSGEHVEEFPEGIVYSEPLDPAFQVHILEPHELEQSHIPVQNSGEEGQDLVKSGVLLQYNCDCPDIIEKLTAIASAYRPRVIVAPWPYMEEKIAITAWRKIEKFDSIDEVGIRNFIRGTFETYDDYIECLGVRDKTSCARQAEYI